jgi:hypothetical protein
MNMLPGCDRKTGTVNQCRPFAQNQRLSRMALRECAFHHHRARAPEMVPSEGRLEIVKVEFHLPAPQIKRAKFLGLDGLFANCGGENNLPRPLSF